MKGLETHRVVDKRRKVVCHSCRIAPAEDWNPGNAEDGRAFFYCDPCFEKLQERLAEARRRAADENALRLASLTIFLNQGHSLADAVALTNAHFRESKGSGS